MVKGYADIRTLVAFSGAVVDGEAGGATYTEPQMNGFGEKELPKRFDTEEYQVLLVAEKYQTGFDQPLLHSMYVDKRLDGVQAVQTLSRLNRIARGKDGCRTRTAVTKRGKEWPAMAALCPTSLRRSRPEEVDR